MRLSVLSVPEIPIKHCTLYNKGSLFTLLFTVYLIRFLFIYFQQQIAAIKKAYQKGQVISILSDNFILLLIYFNFQLNQVETDCNFVLLHSMLNKYVFFARGNRLNSLKLHLLMLLPAVSVACVIFNN